MTLFLSQHWKFKLCYVNLYLSELPLDEVSQLFSHNLYQIHLVKGSRMDTSKKYCASCHCRKMAKTIQAMLLSMLMQVMGSSKFTNSPAMMKILMVSWIFIGAVIFPGFSQNCIDGLFVKLFWVLRSLLAQSHQWLFGY